MSDHPDVNDKMKPMFKSYRHLAAAFLAGAMSWGLIYLALKTFGVV